MVDARAGVILIVLIFYFIGFSLFVNSAENASAVYGLNGSVSTSGGIVTADNPFGALEFCSTPRNYYNQKNGEYERIGFFYAENARCEYTLGSSDINQCTSISGCSVINDTSGWFWNPTTTQVCDGVVNLSVYSTITPIAYAIDDSFRGDLSGNTTDKKTLCSILDSQSSCQILGCSWLDSQDNIDNVKLNTIWDTIGELFSYSIDIGLSDFANFVFISIFFYIPFLILLIALYMLVPFI